MWPRRATPPRSRPLALTVSPLGRLPEVAPGDDLGALLAAAAPEDLANGDVIAVAHKVVSKAEGRVVRLGDVEPGARARALSVEHGKDARLVEVVLSESVELLRAARGVLVCRTRHGFVCANAGVDVSNVLTADEVVLLPLDPDASARRLRDEIASARDVRPAVLVTDSFGRPWRLGQTDVAIGVAGLIPLDDWRGRPDAQGRELRATAIAAADAAAAAADLVRRKDSGEPAVLVRGVEHLVADADGPGASALRRPPEEDLFR
jgi:coenzyme F420-0:L-glutamate ligase/coenzyme F420-1:gamma-L-glutamate ligase